MLQFMFDSVLVLGLCCNTHSKNLIAKEVVENPYSDKGEKYLQKAISLAANEEIDCEFIKEMNEDFGGESIDYLDRFLTALSPSLL